jgi:Zn-finger nucleic acid-binding protein
VIVACPACDARYELEAAADGRRARCRCGTEFTIHAPPAQAAMLACPRCGANVPADAAQCAYCHAALLVKACPRCLARVFAGHKHCPDCGGALDVVATAAASTRPCPRCRVTLVARLVGDAQIDDCTQCGGTFLDRPTIERVLAERQQARADAIVGVYGDGGDAPLPSPPGPMYVKCPDCAQIMNRKQFARGSHVVIDVCRDHGTWFDRHELSRVIRFVMAGGLERAAQEDLADEADRVRRMKADAIAAQATAARMMHSTTVSSDYGALIADVLFQLWK